MQLLLYILTLVFFFKISIITAHSTNRFIHHTDEYHTSDQSFEHEVNPYTQDNLDNEDEEFAPLEKPFSFPANSLQFNSLLSSTINSHNRNVVGTTLRNTSTEIITVSMQLRPLLRKDMAQFNIAMRPVYRNL